MESSTKEAIYALDETTPLRLYNCLVPEITAFRLQKVQTDKEAVVNYAAKLKLKELEFKIVSFAHSRC